MKLFRFAFLLFAVLSVYVFGAEKPIPFSGELRVMSFNIHIGIGMDEKLDLQRTAEAILKEKPDLVALQEVDRFAERTEKLDQPKILAELTGMNVVYGKTIDNSGGDYGIAILSKYPIVEHTFTPLPREDNREKRGLLQATIKLDDSNTIRFFCTHLCAYNEKNRVLQVQKINEIAEKDNSLLLIGGDFNAEPKSDSNELMLKHWKDLTDADPTFSSTKPSIKIDYIFTRAGEVAPGVRKKLEKLESKVIPDEITSDHRPIVTVLKMD